MLKHNTTEIGMQRPSTSIQSGWGNALLSFNQRYRPVLTTYGTVADCGAQVMRSKGVPVYIQDSYRQVCEKLKDFSRTSKTFLLFSRTEKFF